MRRLFIAIFGILLSLFTSTPAFAHDDGDWQLWNTESIEGKLNKGWKVKLEEEFRFGDSMEALYYHHTDLSLTYKLTDWFFLGIAFRQIYEKKNGEWREENRPHINGTFKWTMHEFNLKNRSRLEYRIREGKEETMRYRNKLTVTPPFKWTKLSIQPFVADEVFGDFDKGELNRNRFYMGIKAKLSENLKLNIFYLWQTSKKQEEWLNCNVVGIKLGFVF